MYFLLGLIRFCPTLKKDNIRKKMIKTGVPPNSLLGKTGKKTPEKNPRKWLKKYRMFTICIKQNLRLFPSKFLHKNNLK
jgi:hypothetical protein